MLDDKDTKFTHSIVKEAYINRSMLFDENKEFLFSEIILYDSFDTTTLNHLIFKDELNREIICYTKYVSKRERHPVMYDLKEKRQIQEYKANYNYTAAYYYKDVLDLYNIDDYIFMRENANNYIEITKLDTLTKRFEVQRLIQENIFYLSVIPLSNFNDNMIISTSKFSSKIRFLDNQSSIFLFQSECSFYPFYDSKDDAIYTIQCNKNKVKIYQNDEDFKSNLKYKLYSHENLTKNADIIIKDNKKYVYCSSTECIIIFEYDNENLLLKLDHCNNFFKLSKSSILKYDSGKNGDILLIFETDSLRKNDEYQFNSFYYYLNNVNLKILNSSSHYLSLHTRKEIKVYKNIFDII